MISALQKRFLIVFWAGDHLVLALCTLGNCRRYEMISSALWELDRDGRWMGRVFRPVVDFVLRPLGADHCRNSWRWQRGIF